jgi:UDP-2,4-diacetamido-2,4,6-trideoxy-beta-L-altropyranose hydrolase
MPPGTLILRADASIAMGTGHVMRCLALAQAWQDEGGNCVFAMAETTPAVQNRVRAEKFEVSSVVASPASQEDAVRVVELAAAHRASWIVADGYQFDVAYQHALKRTGLQVLLVDDGGRCGSYCTDFVLDQSLDASEVRYRNRESYTRLLLGTSYVMLRREFTAWRKWKRETPPVAQRLLVTIGGSDPGGLTLKIITALRYASLPGLATTVVVGGSNPRLDELRRAAGATPSSIDLICDPPNLPELMAQSDMAVICAGGTLGELLYMGCPSLSYVRDELQAQIIARLYALGAVHNLGAVEEFDESRLTAAIEELAASQTGRDKVVQIGRKIVDGEGPRRVLHELLGGPE